MATKNFRSTVLEPTSEFAHGDKLRFTALATVGEVLKGSFSETTIGEDGVYSVDLQYGKHRIDYKPYEGVWRHFADVEVNADTLATTLQDLALASVPVTDETVLVLQGILADAEAAKAESAAIRDEAAASAEAAAADAAKLADVTPDSIGAVNADSGYVAIKPDDAYLTRLGSSDYRKYIILKLPVADDTQIGLHLRIMSRVDYLSTDFFVYLFNRPSISSTSGLIVSHNLSGAPYTVDVYHSSAGETNLVIYTEFRFLDSFFTVLDVMTGQGVTNAQAEHWKSGWSSTYSDDISVDLGTKVGSVTQESLIAPAVINVQKNGIVYNYSESDSDIAELHDNKAAFDAALAQHHAHDLFKSEKSIALQIMADFNLGTGEQEITGADIADVRAYIQSIDPAKGLKAGHLQRAKIPRPSIFDRYS